MNLSPELIAYLVAQALASAQAVIAAFERVHGRTPTLEEYQQLEGDWKTAAEIEAAVHAKFPKPNAG